MFKLYFYLIRKQIISFFTHRDLARISVAIVFFLILLFLASLSFIFGRAFTQYMTSFGSFSQIFLRFILLSLISALSLLSLVSFIIAFFKTLFEKNLSIFFPIFPPEKIAFSVLIYTFILGSWPFLLVSLPFFFGMGKLFHYSGGFYFLTIFLHLVLSLMIAGFSGGITLLLKKNLGENINRYFPVIILLLMIVFFLTFTGLVFPSNLEKITSYKEISQVEKSMSASLLNLPILPTGMFVSALFGDSTALFGLVAIACGFTAFFYLFSRKFYLDCWQLGYEGHFMADRQIFRNGSKAWQPGNIFSKSPLPPWYLKEILYLARTANAYIYFSFIILLSFLFIFFLSKIKVLQGDYAQFTNFVTIASFFSISYLTLLLGLRFVFPSFSLEAPFVWLLITSQSFRQKISEAKWLFSFFLSLIFIMILDFAILIFTNLSKIVSIQNFLYLSLCNMFIILSLSLLIGQIWERNLPKEDVEAISTTNAGILLTVLSLLTGLLLSFLLLYRNFSLFIPILLIISAGFYILGFKISLKRYLQNDIGV